MHRHLCVYVYILKIWERKTGKLPLFFFNTVWKIIIINWYDTNAGFFQCWAVNWDSNSFQDAQFCSVRCIQHAKMCAASKRWELWERLWQRSQHSTQIHSFREHGICVPKKLWISSWKSPLQYAAYSWHSYQITEKLKANGHDPTNSYF